MKDPSEIMAQYKNPTNSAAVDTLYFALTLPQVQLDCIEKSIELKTLRDTGAISYILDGGLFEISNEETLLDIAVRNFKLKGLRFMKISSASIPEYIRLYTTIIGEAPPMIFASLIPDRFDTYQDLNELEIKIDNGKTYVYKSIAGLSARFGLYFRGPFENDWKMLNFTNKNFQLETPTYLSSVAFVLYSVDGKVVDDEEFKKYLKDYPGTLWGH